MPEPCRAWREELGVHALGQLEAGPRDALFAHVSDCEACREEADRLATVVRMLAHADPMAAGAAEVPAPRLADAIASRIAGERRRDARPRRARAIASGAAAVALAAAAVAIVQPGAATRPLERERVAFSGLPPGVALGALLSPSAGGTRVEIEVDGLPAGSTCVVALRRADGTLVPAGSFRYRYDGAADGRHVLNAALDREQATALVVRAGARTFTARLPAATVRQ